jgi:hypothetical protein
VQPHFETTTMKKFKKQNTPAKTAFFAGAAALMALTPQTRAQSSMDALLNKLEQKGVLTVDEAKEMKAENETNSIADINAAMNSKFPTPDWVTSYKFSGDFRGRFDDMSSGNPAIVDRDRLRYRLRAGLTIDMTDNLEVGFRVASGDNSQGVPSSPLSNNQTLNSDGSKKPLYIDTAYGRWTPINDGTWMAVLTFGKMVEPFDTSPMVFDPDYTPEGGALQTAYKLNDHQSFRFNSAAFVLDEIKSSTRDPFMFGGQIFWDAKWTSRIGTTLGVSAYDIINEVNLAGPTVYDTNLGNTTAGGHFAAHFNPVVVSGSATYTLDSFPLYAGAFPIKLGGEYMDNPATAGNNKGWWGGLTLGKSGKKGTWDLSYRYQRLEANAWWDQIVDDDNAAAFPTSATAAGLAGGTNIKGHLVKLDYSLTDALTFSFTCYVNDLINNPVTTAKTDAIHAMADLMWKF